jgi:hypothetical protein
MGVFTAEVGCGWRVEKLERLEKLDAVGCSWTLLDRVG